MPREEDFKPTPRFWEKRVREAREYFEPVFRRMRRNIEFVYGLQRPGQKALDEDEYTANLILRILTQKCANLYAKDPKTEVRRARRLNYTVWDGRMETLQAAVAAATRARAGGTRDLAAEAILNDFATGFEQERQMDRVAETLQIVDDYFIRTARPEYKEQMKQLIMRVLTCGVGYLRQTLVRTPSSPLSTVETRHTTTDVAERAATLEKVIEDPEDQRATALVSLYRGLGVSDPFELPERIEFDFLPATSVIPDPKTRSLREFIGASWIAIEYNLPLFDVNAAFGLDIKAADINSTDPGDSRETTPKEPPKDNPDVTVWEIWDYESRTRCYILKGYDEFLLEPSPPEFPVSGFWPLIALTFNHTEVDPGTRASVFPPSDVDLLRPIQEEWNRVKSALREHREANAPRYVVQKGILTDENRTALQEAQPHQVIELELPLDKNPADILVPLRLAPITPDLYTTAPLSEDIFFISGFQEADLLSPRPRVTATVGTIAEQARQTVLTSNIDDLDAFLSRAARMRGELFIQGLTEETVRQIAGPGAAWPSVPEDRRELLKFLTLSVVAASSGRPNRALNIASLERLAPYLIQAGANPVGVIELLAKAYDETLDMNKLLPVQSPYDSGRADQGSREGR